MMNSKEDADVLKGCIPGCDGVISDPFPGRAMRWFFCALTAVMFPLHLLLPAVPYDQDTPRFLLSTFSNAQQTKLYLASSFDGRNYIPVGGGPVYETTDSNLIRDPSIVRYRGVWYVCHTAGTDLGNASFFRVLSSADLRTWTRIKDVDMSAVPNTRYTWAPEWFIDDDGSLHVLVSTSHWGTYEHVIHEIHPLDPDNLSGSWSAPARLGGPAFPEFTPLIDGNGLPVNGQRVGAYDAYLLKIQGTYHIWYFNRSTSSLAHATAPALLGPYTADATKNLYGTGYWMEGETMVHLGGSSWRFSYANAMTSALWYVESADNWATWSPPVQVGSPAGTVFNHGTVIFNPFAPDFSTEISVSANNELRMVFPSLKANGYQFQSSDNLVDWSDDGPAFSGTGFPVEILRSADIVRRKFYRVKWLPFW